MALIPFSQQSTSRISGLRTNQKGAIVLFGEVLVDIFHDRAVLGGAPFNVARHLKAFGQNPVLITRLGNDKLGEQVLGVMSQNGMETIGIQCGNRHPTGRVLVHFKDGQHRFDILPAQAYDFIHPSMVRMTTLSVDPALVYFGTLAQRNEISGRALKVLLRSTGSMKFLDINLRAPWYDEKTIRQSLQYADVMKLNAEELGLLAEMFDLAGNTEQNQVVELMNRFDLNQAVVTCGKNGAWQIDRNGRITEAAGKDTEAKTVDTVGAGDGFSAVCILGTLLHWSVTVTLERANSFAAAICGIRGAIPDHADFYQPYTRDWGI